MPSEAPTPRPTFLDTFSPIDTGFTGAVIFLLSHLILVPACSPVRLGDEGWAWLDAYRVSPSRSGWLAYGTYGLAVASLLGALLGAAHRLALKTVRSDRVRYLLGLAFMLIAAVVSFLLPLFLHRGTRLPLRPTADASRAVAAAGSSDFSGQAAHGSGGRHRGPRHGPESVSEDQRRPDRVIGTSCRSPGGAGS